MCYKKEGTSQQFYYATYASLPYIKHELVNKFSLILNKETYSKEDQVQLIVSLEELISLSTLNRKLKTTSILEDIEKYFLYFSRLFIPIFISISFIVIGLLLIVINNYSENEFWEFANPILFADAVF